MKRFRLIYNGITSVFNAYKCGGGRAYGAKWVDYNVRPSKGNTMGISHLCEMVDADGSVSYHFNCRTIVPRGLEVFCEEVK